MTSLSDITVRGWRRVQLTGMSWTIANFFTAPMLHEPPAVFIPSSILAPLVANAGSIGLSLRSKRDKRELQATENAKRDAEAKHYAEVHRVAVRNPQPGQCPVCGLTDLLELAQTDAYCGDTGDSAMAFVVPYGPHHAHVICATVVPYDKFYKKTPEDMHHRGYHHAQRADNCTACKDGGWDRIPAATDCTCITCKTARGITGDVFAVDGRAYYQDPSAHPKPAYGDIVRLSLPEGPVYWKCHNCRVDGHAPTYADGEMLLREHARRCPGRDHNHGYQGVYRMGCRECDQLMNKRMGSTLQGQVDNALAQTRTILSSALDAIATTGFTVADAGDHELDRAMRIKNALAPNQAMDDWLSSAVNSTDPGVREAAWAVLDRMGIRKGE